MNAYSAQHRRHAAGIVLPVVLIMLLILTIASLVIIEQIGSQTRMAGNSAAEQLSVQAAEATLRHAANQLNSGSLSGFRNNTGGLYCNRPDCGLLTTPPWTVAANWTGALSAKITATDDGSLHKFMIEELPPVVPRGSDARHPLQVYRITARVAGPDGNSVVMLQTLFQKP
ncbi:pilus assembly PilX family protein [Dyella silvatica]|uniref:pilus assembly PilX family protein n=1 Tax=Dyella silvatica TaxID=2992128 RepID=UPI002253847A|nr:hypothetical protein [Dyella silvatica]